MLHNLFPSKIINIILITEWLSWHWIFLINIPAGLIVLLFSKRLLLKGDTKKGKIDLTCALLAITGHSL
ncbi:hypothetical protein [Sphingobacterium puteale]|uniref:hypothetical protein n=1 Tax=Sphingobacterium puteale TaxID=2420510 RepID=UPI003D9819DE